MTNRLKLICSLISHGKGMIDVGTDHGYIPVELARCGYPGKIIASDINVFPLEAARATASRAGMEDRIEFMVSDGLHGCNQEEISTIVIAGMGGDLICRILDDAAWCQEDRFTFILQPMTKKEILRYWLINNGFGDISEYLTQDGGKIYQVIKVRYNGANVKYSDAELFIGKAYDPLKTDGKLYEDTVRTELERISKKYFGLKSKNTASGETIMYQKIYEEMKGMIPQ